MKIRPPSPSLFLQTLGLVVATLIAAEATTVAVVMSLPPPPPDVYTVADVLQAVRHQGRTQTLDGRDLTARLARTPPAPNTDGRRRLRFRAALAGALDLPPASVVVAQPGPRIVALAASPPQRPHLAQWMEGDDPILLGGFQVGVKQPDGEWLVVAPMSAFGIDPWQQRLLLVMAVAAVAVSPLAWWFSRRIAAPMTALAEGADRLGRDPAAPRLEIRGPAEVTAAVLAFNEMQERLRQYVEDRTQMVGAIAHDLRTPLTRMRFRIESALTTSGPSSPPTSTRWRPWSRPPCRSCTTLRARASA